MNKTLLNKLGNNVINSIKLGLSGAALLLTLNSGHVNAQAARGARQTETFHLGETYTKKVVFEDRTGHNFVIHSKIILDALSKIKTQELLGAIDTIILLPQGSMHNSVAEPEGGHVNNPLTESTGFSIMYVVDGSKEEIMETIWHEAAHLLNTKHFLNNDTIWDLSWQKVVESGLIPNTFEDEDGVLIYSELGKNLTITNDPLYGFCCPAATANCDEDVAYFTAAVYQLLAFNNGPLLLIKKNTMDPRYPVKLHLLMEGGFISKDDYQSAKKILDW